MCVCEVLRESETDLILKFVIFSSGAPQVVRYSVSKEVEAISGRDVRLEMEVCSDKSKIMINSTTNTRVDITMNGKKLEEVTRRRIYVSSSLISPQRPDRSRE